MTTAYYLPVTVNFSRPVHRKMLYKIKMNQNFYFRTSLWYLKKFYEGP